MITDLTKFRYEAFDFGDAVNMSPAAASSLEVAKKEAQQAKELAEKIAAEVPPEQTFTLAQMEAAKKACLAEGKAAGIAEAEAASQKARDAEAVRVEEMLIKIESQLAGYEKEAHKQRLAVAEKLKAVAFAAAKKVINGLPGSAIKQIENFVDGALGVVNDDKKIVLHLHPVSAKAFIEKMSERFEHMEIVEDDSILQNDMKIVWNNGYSERKLDELWKEIGQIVVGEFKIDEFAAAEVVVEEVQAVAKEPEVKEEIAETGEVEAASEEITNITGEENGG